jgi:hypothetical protein
LIAPVRRTGRGRGRPLPAGSGQQLDELVVVAVAVTIFAVAVTIFTVAVIFVGIGIVTLNLIFDFVGSRLAAVVFVLNVHVNSP